MAGGSAPGGDGGLGGGLDGLPNAEGDLSIVQRLAVQLLQRLHARKGICRLRLELVQGERFYRNRPLRDGKRTERRGDDSDIMRGLFVISNVIVTFFDLIFGVRAEFFLRWMVGRGFYGNVFIIGT